MELPSHVDPAYISRAVRTLCVEGDVIEARVLGAPRAGHISGYFDDFDQLASAVARYDGQAEAAYFTLNPVQPALLARGNNRLVEWAKHATSDADILCRRWMMIDFDPARAADNGGLGDAPAACRASRFFALAQYEKFGQQGFFTHADAVVLASEDALPEIVRFKREDNVRLAIHPSTSVTRILEQLAHRNRQQWARPIQRATEYLPNARAGFQHRDAGRHSLNLLWV